MADATVTSVTPNSGPSGTEITITGSALTKTTTLLFIGGLETIFTWVSDTEIAAFAEGDPGAVDVVVEKAGVRSSPVSFTITEAAMADETTTTESPPAGGIAGSAGTVPISVEDTMTEQEKNPGGDPVSAAVPLGQQLAPEPGVAPREPYPTGSPAVPPTDKVPMNEAPPEVV